MGRRYQVPKQQLDVISAGQKEVVRSEGSLYPAVDQRWVMVMMMMTTTTTTMNSERSL